MEDLELKPDYESKILSGSLDFDNWLCGGFEKGIITLFYGPAASGKSNFMMLVSYSQAKLKKKVLFIDTEGSFSVDRMKQISNNNHFKEVLKNIMLFKPVSLYEQNSCLKKILKKYKSENISLIIIDSFIMLYRLELADARKSGIDSVRILNSNLAEQMRILYEIARKKNIPIIITSQVYSDFLNDSSYSCENIKLAGGDILKYWSKCIIELKNKNFKRKAILIKHRSLPQKELFYEIYSSGIRKKRWL
jgi:DNA repair protein RadB